MAKKKKESGLSQSGGVRMGSPTVSVENNVAAKEEPPVPEGKAWVDYCPECLQRDMRSLPVGNISKHVGRQQCGRCSAFKMKSEVFTDKE